MSGTAPAAAGKRLCGICGKPLATYNKDDICSSHSSTDKINYRDRMKRQARGGRELLSFVKEFHKAGTVDDMFKEATRGGQKSAIRARAEHLERYHEALRVLQIASLRFRISMPGILRAKADSKNPKFARDIVAYVMHKDLCMDVADICTFFGFQYAPGVAKSIASIDYAFIEDEDIILAVDIVRQDFERLNAD